jgi:hypothetical protein
VFKHTGRYTVRNVLDGSHKMEEKPVFIHAVKGIFNAHDDVIIGDKIKAQAISD